MTYEININISKARVLDEVDKRTAYIGKKATSEQDPGAYERVATVDANREQLDIYWMEACSDATTALDHWATSVRSQVLSHHPEIGTDHNFLESGRIHVSTPFNIQHSKTRNRGRSR